MNWGLQNRIKIHKVKSQKNLTVMLISDPTKEGVSLRVPKWVRFPLMLLSVVMILGVLYTYSYIVELENQVAVQRSEVQSGLLTILNKDHAMDELQETNAKRFDQLQGLAVLTVTLKERLSELESYKRVIDNKLETAEIVPESQSTRQSVRKNNSDSPSLGGFDLTGFQNDRIFSKDAPSSKLKSDFTIEGERLLNELTSTIDAAQVEQVQYAERDKQVDENLPYWAAYPSVMPLSDTYITSPYGYRQNPFGRSMEFHKGVDFKANYQEVWATGAGTVTYAGYNNGYGNLVIIDHGYGIITMYAHNSKLLVEEGDKVERYDVIAVSGNSGRSSGPHLHYEIHKNGETQDPMDYIKQGE